MPEIKTNLADAYKIISYLGMDDHTYTHLSARSREPDSFYIYPFGFRFEEVMPEDLMKVSLRGEVLEGSEYQYNQTGYMIHSKIYAAREDIGAVFHLHTPSIVAVSAMNQGLMPISQWALHFYGRLSYHEYDSLALDSGRANKLIDDLGNNNTLLLRNHGSITCGKTIEEAMFYSYHLEQACKTQCQALNSNSELVFPDEETCNKAVGELLNFETDLGQRDWQAWIRMLDRAGRK
jgi:ribulose-5-phosphate 4-epimerase/fuculose-1-phosphate aldolase